MSTCSVQLSRTCQRRRNARARALHLVVDGRQTLGDDAERRPPRAAARVAVPTLGVSRAAYGDLGPSATWRRPLDRDVHHLSRRRGTDAKNGLTTSDGNDRMVTTPRGNCTTCNACTTPQYRADLHGRDSQCSRRFWTRRQTEACVQTLQQRRPGFICCASENRTRCCLEANGEFGE